MSSLDQPKIVHSLEVQQDRYDYYCKLLGLTDEVLKDISSICDIGSGANDFVAMLRKQHPHIFAMGVESKESSYELLDKHSINHDARSIGIPDSAPKFDLVVSLDAVPKLFGSTGAGAEESSDIFDHSMFKELPQDPEGATVAIVQALSEMLRITKVNGRVILYPVLTYKTGVRTVPEMQNVVAFKIDEEAFFRLKQRYPKLAFKFVVDEERTVEERKRQGKPVFVSRVEIRKRA